jgi:hypothetical protein
MTSNKSLQSHLLRRLLTEGEAAEIRPELLDFIGGETEQEIDTSIERAVEKSKAITQGIQAALGQPVQLDEQWLDGQRQGIGDEAGFRPDMTTAEYAAWREHGPGRRSASARGMFD